MSNNGSPSIHLWQQSSALSIISISFVCVPFSVRRFSTYGLIMADGKNVTSDQISDKPMRDPEPVQMFS